MSDWFKVKELKKGIWALQEPHHVEGVISYLIVGSERAVLFDTGMGISNIRAVVEELNTLPVLVVNSHSHYDHVGDNHRFDQIAIHQAESKQIETGVSAGELAALVDADTFIAPPPSSFRSKDYQIRPSKPTLLLKDGDELALGGRTLEIIHTPGHSPGSICLFDKSQGMLFSGDTVYNGSIYVQLPGSDFFIYHKSMERLSNLVADINTIFPAHGNTPIGTEFINKILDSFNNIAQGGSKYWYEPSPWGRIRVYELDGIKVYLKNNS